MPLFEGHSADDVWRLAVDALKARSSTPLQPGRGGSTRELLHVNLHFDNPRQRWIVSRNPGMSVAFVIVEVIGILNGRKDSAYLNFFNPRLPKLAGHGPEYYGAYGFRLRSAVGFDQLARAREAFRHNPDGRQIVLQIWDALKDFPSAMGKPAAEDIPCNVCSMLKMRDGKLEWTQVMRSNDIFKGLPYNFVQFTTLQEVMAGWLGVQPGSYSHYSDSLHVYEEDMEATFGYVPTASLLNNDNLALPLNQSEPIWKEMNRRVNKLASDRVAQKDFSKVAQLEDAPQAFTNLMAVVAADAARRRGHLSEAQTCMALCDSAILQHLWTRWAEWKKVPRAQAAPATESKRQLR